METQTNKKNTLLENQISTTRNKMIDDGKQALVYGLSVLFLAGCTPDEVAEFIKDSANASLIFNDD